MAYVDAKLNYKIMDKLIEVWDDLGFNKDIAIAYSTPTQYYKGIKYQNDYRSVKANATNKYNETWPLRKDDSFPY